MDDDPGPSSLWGITYLTSSLSGSSEIEWGILSGILIKVLFIVFSGILSALFSGSEVAILSVNRMRLLELKEEGNKSAEILLEILEKPKQVVSSLLVANTTVNVVMVVLWTSILMTLSGPSILDLESCMFVLFGKSIMPYEALILISGGILLTIIIILFCEILPKNLFHRHPEQHALKRAAFLRYTIRALQPIVWFTYNTSKFILRAFGITLSSAAGPITEEEIIDLIDVGEEEGLIQKQEREMIHSIIEFGDLRVRDVMIPRVDMKALKKNESVTTALKMVVNTGHSRIPVYGKDRDNIIGIIYAKDLLDHLGDENLDQLSLSDMIREVEFVPEEMLLINLFNEMKRKKNHFAIVADEYGGTAGLITIEDVLEEIVGDIEDEFDREQPLYRVEKDKWIVDGKLNLRELEDLIKVDLPENGADTVGGLIYYTMGKIPEVGDELEFPGVNFKILTVDNQRITEIEIQKSDAASDSEMKPGNQE